MQRTRRTFLKRLGVGVGAILGRGKLSFADRPPDVRLRIERLKLEVAAGHFVETVGYNGSIPGPLLRLQEGIPVIVDITNETDRTEYVHWHGFPVPAQIDGAQEEKSLAVPARGHLQYEMTPSLAGTRWVHSHAMAMTDLTRGVYSGQFGFAYVEPAKNAGSYDQEIFLATHEWEPFFAESDEDIRNAPEKFGETDWGPVQVEVGYRIRTINAKVLGHGEPIRVKEGQRVLLHVLNASATENLALALWGHEFLVTALDGNPVPRPHSVHVLELGVGERVDAMVEMKTPGVWILGSTDPDVRGAGMGISVEYAGQKGTAKAFAGPISDWDYTIFGRNPDAREPDETIPVVIERVVPNPQTKGFEMWTINGNSFDPNAAPQKLRRGARYRLVFDNRSADAHPLHLHRHSFELASINGKKTSGVMKDVVLVKAYQTVEVDFTANQEGLALFHCHQQLHMDRGFKTLFSIV